MKTIQRLILSLLFLPVLVQAQGFFVTGFWQPQTSLVFTTSAQTNLASICSGVVTVQSRNSGGVATNVSADLIVSLSGTGSVIFYSDSACAVPITSVTIVAGTSAASFYFMDTTTGSRQITASAVGYTPGVQTETENTNNFIWKGTVSTDWATGGNWSGGVAPGTSDIAVFDGTCVTNCNAVLSGAVSIRGLRLNSGYTGTITQGSYDITLAWVGFTQISGTFAGTTNLANTITVNGGSVAIAGGTFTAPTGTMLVKGGWQVLNSPTVTMPSGSTLDVECAMSLSPCYNTTLTLAAGSVTYQNVILQGYHTIYDLGAGTMTVAGNLTLGDYYVNGGWLGHGTINVGGNITLSNNGYLGTATLVATGNASGQTITGIAGKLFPSLQIAAGTNPVTLSGTIVTAIWTYTSSGTFTATGSTLDIECGMSYAPCYNIGVAITPGSVTYNNVIIQGYHTTYDLGGATMNVGGDLTIGDYYSGTGRGLNNGIVNVGGNITLTNYGVDLYASSTIVATGKAAGQTITGLSGKYFPKLQIAAGTNPVTLSGTISTSSWIVSSMGTLTATGSTLDIECSASTAVCVNATSSITPGTGTYNDVIIHGYKTSWDFGGGTFNIAGNFTFGELNSGPGYFLNGTINVGGNITQTNIGNYGPTTTIVATGNPAGQTITGLAGKWFPKLQIAAGANPITLSGSILTPVWTMTSVGTFTTTGSTLDIECTVNWSTTCYNTTTAITPGSVNYNNVNLRGYRTTWDLGGGSMNVGGLLTIGDLNGTNQQINNGTFAISGGLTNAGFGNKGSAQMQFVGSGAQTLNAGAQSMPAGAVTVSLTGGGTLTQSSATATFSSLSITSGTMLMSGNALTITGLLSISSGATLTKGGGTLTYGSLANSGTLNP